jgi:hypothetical protein
MPSTLEFSIFAVVCPTNTTSSGIREIYAQSGPHGTATSTGQIGFYLNASGKPALSVSGTTSSSWTVVTGATTVTGGTCHSLAGTRDSSGSLRIYLDGVFDGTSASTNSFVTRTNHQPAIGWDRNWNADYFNGRIGQVSTWTRQLTLSEIQSLDSATGL